MEKSGKQEYVLWNAVSVPLLQFARYCSIVQTLSLKYIRVATLTLRLHDVVGHLITLHSISDTCFIGTDTVHGSMPAKFEVRIFSLVGVISF